MIKIFRGGGRGGDTFKTPSPYEQLLPLPTPCFKMFLERSLNDPHPHYHTSSIFHCYPLPIHHPFPRKNFDHTPSLSLCPQFETNLMPNRKRSLNDPHPHHPTSSIFHCYPSPSTTPSPPPPLKILIIHLH